MDALGFLTIVTEGGTTVELHPGEAKAPGMVVTILQQRPDGIASAAVTIKPFAVKDVVRFLVAYLAQCEEA